MDRFDCENLMVKSWKNFDTFKKIYIKLRASSNGNGVRANFD